MKTFSKKQLIKWGLFQQACGQEIIDRHILEVPEPSSQKIEELVDKWLKVHSIDSQESLKVWLNQHEMSQEEWNDLVIREWLWAKWCLNHFDANLSSYYLKRKEVLDQVTYSLLRVKQKHLANELYLRIKEKESTFKEIASVYSEGPEKESGGFLGPMSLSQPHPLLARFLKISSPGQLWPPKQFESWWIVVRLENLQIAELNEPLAMRLALELGEKYLQESYKKITTADTLQKGQIS